MKTIRKEYWMQTVGGGSFSFTNPTESAGLDPAELVKTIAHSLAYIPRFGGHTKTRWTVGHHTLGVETIGLQLLTDVREKAFARPYLLLHDAHEGFGTGDMAAPLKFHLKDHLDFDWKKLVEAPIDRFIRRTLGMGEPLAWITDLVREADLYALKLERDLFMPSKHEWVVDEVVIPSTIKWESRSQLSSANVRRILHTHINAALEEYVYARQNLKS